MTGAASGIGLAFSKALLARGAKVMMADIDAEGLNAAQASLNRSDDTNTVSYTHLTLPTILLV